MEKKIIVFLYEYIYTFTGKMAVCHYAPCVANLNDNCDIQVSWRVIQV